MKSPQFSRRSLPLALAALLTLASPGVRPASAAPRRAAGNEAAQVLSAQLPSGTTLRSATCKQTASATKAAVAQRTDLAPSIVGAAIVARTPKQGEGEIDCKCVMDIVTKGIASAPQSSREIVEMALSLAPQCDRELQDLLNGGDGADADFQPNQGFGIGFPGSPGFTGSGPGGTIALPPIGVAVTPASNG